VNATVGQVATYADERCGGGGVGSLPAADDVDYGDAADGTLPAVRAACDATVECVGFTYAAVETMCYTFIMEQYVFTQGMEVSGSSPAAVGAQAAGAAAAADSGLYFLKHRAQVHRVRSYGEPICGLTVPQQKADCDAVFECVG
jgi:hypothetical protein